MKKADLLRLPKLKITKEIKEVAKSDKGTLKGTSQYKYRIYKYKNYYRAKVFENILKVVIYTRDDVLREIPSYLIFISKNKKKYITWDVHGEKWRTAKIDRLDGNWSYYEEKRYYSRGAEKAIIDYLGREEKTGYEAMYQFQSEIRSEKLKRKHRRITDQIDSRMELVPELPKKFNKWIDKTAMIHSRYIYYKYSRNITEGYCTHCKKIVKLKEKPKYNKEGTCPECNSKITYKTEAKAGTVNDVGQASIFQKTKEGFILRYFEITKNYVDYKNPTYITSEMIRRFYDENLELTECYEFTMFKGTRIIRWCTRENNRNYYSSMSNSIYEYKSTLYTRNLKRIIKNTKYQYSAIEIFARNIHQFYPMDYLNNYKRDKFIEYLVKAKLYNITRDYINSTWRNEINQAGERIHDVLKIRKDQVKELSKTNPNIEQLTILQKANERNVTLTTEQLKAINEFGSYRLLNYMNIKTPHKIIRYVTEQTQKHKEKLSNVARNYYDYLEISTQLERDLNNDFIFFPKNLEEAHDAAVEDLNYKKQCIQEAEDNENDIELNKIAKELEIYLMKDKNLEIRIPTSVKDLRNEGNELHHCVATYVERVVLRETIILFIRETKDPLESFYTMEISEGKVIQVRGKYNFDPTQEVKAFVERFKKKKLYKHPERHPERQAV